LEPAARTRIVFCVVFVYQRVFFLSAPAGNACVVWRPQAENSALSFAHAFREGRGRAVRRTGNQTIKCAGFAASLCSREAVRRKRARAGWRRQWGIAGRTTKDFS